MVQIISSAKFDMQTFAFQRGVTYDSHAVRTVGDTLTSEDIPGLLGSYTYTSSAILWNGAATFANATSGVVYAGRQMGANAAGTPNEGTVTGILQGSGGLGSFLIGVSINASDIFDASQTTSREDDTAILRITLSGNDRITLSDFADVIASQNGNDIVRAGAGNDDIAGNSGADTLFGGTGDDSLSGGFGYDSLSGGEGRDVIHGDAGSDRIRGDQGSDTLYGDAGRDRLIGGYGYDKLYGGAGADKLIGGNGRDALYGGADADVDTFIFKSIEDSPNATQRDVVHDFTRGTDKIDLSALDANSTQTGDQAFTFGGQTAAAHAVWYRLSGTGLIVSADVTGDTQADFSIRVSVMNGLSATDFIL